jgi:hypothetical protein
MSPFLKQISISALLSLVAMADEAPVVPPTTVSPVAAKHQEGSNKVADRQDELAADVQQITLEQTVPQVIALLREVEKIMDETTDQLAGADTGDKTLAAETEIIEKIHAAAKEKQKSGGKGEGQGQAGGAMMDMLERMMDKKPEGQKPGPGGKPGQPGEGGESPGKGQTGQSDTPNDPLDPAGANKSEARRVPKASGNAGHALPEEFRKALDAYNRGAEKKLK